VYESIPGRAFTGEREHVRTGDESMLYFSYGSNMLSERLRTRAPSCKPIGVAHLAGHVLRFHKRSGDGSGKCNALRSCDTSDLVVGVLYEIRKAERNTLDNAEFLGRGYDRVLSIVELGDSACSVEAEVYFALDHVIDDTLLPYSWYKELVVAGAREHGLPSEYIANIVSHPTTKDSDPRREQLHLKLLGNGDDS